jgi:hypothetical protein
MFRKEAAKKVRMMEEKRLADCFKSEVLYLQSLCE